MAKARVTEKWREQIEKGMMPESVHKTFVPESVTGSEANGVRKAAFVVSTGNEDRDGDIVNPNGWMLDNYRKNPVVLWAHDVKALPVARAEQIGVQGGKLKSVTVFPEKGVYPFADQVFGLVRDGFLKGTSVGFHPLEAAPRKGKSKGVQFDRQELYEFSILPIPSNREALAEAKAAGHDVSMVVKWAEDFLDYAEGQGIWVPKYQIQKALALVLPLQVTVPAMPPREADSTEGHAMAGAVLSDAEVKGLLDIIEKGDLPGHEFRGNQYTSGGGGGKDDSMDRFTQENRDAKLQAMDAAMRRDTPPGEVGFMGTHAETRGRFSAEEMEVQRTTAKQMAGAAASLKEGGFTIDPVTHETPKDGFMVSPYKDRERVIEGDATAEDIAKFMRDNADLLGRPGFFVGGWKDGGKSYLDVSIRSDSLEKAKEVARKNGQLAVFDLATFTTHNMEPTEAQMRQTTESYKYDDMGSPNDDPVSRAATKVRDAEAGVARARAKKEEAQKRIDASKSRLAALAAKLPPGYRRRPDGSTFRQPTTLAENQNMAQAALARRARGKKEAEMDVIKSLADELFGEDVRKAAPPWAQEGPAPDENGKINPDEAAKAAREQAQAQNESAKEDAGDAGAEGGPEDADPGEVPGGDPTEADPTLGGMLDQLAQSLLAEIQPLKQGGEPTQIATALKTALEKFAASFMQTYIVPGAQAGVAPGAPPAGAPPQAPPPPGAPPAKPGAPPAAPAQAAPGAPPAKPGAPPAAPGAPPAAPGKKPPFPPKKEDKGFVIEGLALDEAELRATIESAVRKNISAARMHLTGKLPG